MTTGVLKKVIKLLIPPVLMMIYFNLRGWRSLFERRGLKDSELYTPIFSPWLGLKNSLPDYHDIHRLSLVSDDRIWVLRSLLQQALALSSQSESLDCFELGVFRGGTAKMFARMILEHNALLDVEFPVTLRLFDTFDGMPETDSSRDYHNAGDFQNTNLDLVKKNVGEGDFIRYYPGFIPDTFTGLEGRNICFAHIDVDIYCSVLDSCHFVYDRLVSGGVIVFDDYGFPSCPGARMAVDEFFANKPEVPLVLQTGQAVMMKLPK